MKKMMALHKGMGQAVLARLQDFTELPAHGYVAGQAVASAVSELFGDGRAVKYNDVDVFRPTTDVEDDESARRWKAAEQRSQACQTECAPLNNLCSFGALEAQVDHYGQLVYVTADKYTVRSTARSGMLNEVACADLTTNPVEFLQTFDLNAVQVGVDLNTKELIWTPDFARFSNSHQLEIVTLHTPFHSLVRYFKKRAELDGIYGNDERVIELIGAAYHKAEWMREQRKGKSIDGAHLRWRFGRMYKEKLDAVASQVLPHFEVVPLTQSKSEIYMLKPRFNVPDDLLNAPGPIAQTMPRYSRALREKHRPGVQARFDYLASAQGYCPTRLLWLTGSDEYLAANVTAAELKRMDRVISNHVRLGPAIGSLPSLTEQWAAVKLLMAEASQRGGWVYGAVENAKEPTFAPEELTSFLDEQAALLRQRLKKRGVPSLTIQDYTFTELVTGMELADEGEDLCHCVGGYAEGVKAGVSCIISVRSGDSAHNRLTLDMRLGNDRTWSRAQLRGLQNRVPTSQESAIVAKYEEQFRYMKIFGARLGLWLLSKPKFSLTVKLAVKVLGPVNAFIGTPREYKGQYLASAWYRSLQKLGVRLFGKNCASTEKGFLMSSDLRYWTHGLACLVLGKNFEAKAKQPVFQELVTGGNPGDIGFEDIPF